jgi:hypothetical protein
MRRPHNPVHSQARHERITNNELFKLAVRPKTLSQLMFARYERGKNYDSHVGDPSDWRATSTPGRMWVED